MNKIFSENNKFYFLKSLNYIENDNYIVFIDIVEFREINSTYGYDKGDSILEEILRHIISIEDVINCTVYEKDNIIFTVNSKYDKKVNEIIKEIVSFKYSIAMKFRVAYKKLENRVKTIEMLENIEKIIKGDKYLIDEKNQSDLHITKDLDITKDLERYAEIKNEILYGEKMNFYLCYQPKVDIKTNKITGCEVLTRWEHPKLGFLSPGEFLQIINKINLQYEFDIFIFEELCKEMSLKSIDVKYVSINFSTESFKNENLVDKLIYITEKYNINRNNLTIEILEDNIISDDEICERVNKLQQSGFKISIDDFGTGYSSYYRLAKLNFEEVKIPREFITIENNDNKAINILKGIVSMCKSINCDIVVEGIENEKDINLIKELDIDYLQGYFYSKPIKVKEFISLVNSFNEGGERIG